MPNPVAANDSTPISGSLQTSRISYGVDLIGKNYGQNYNGTKWYSDIPNDGTYYTIVSDNYTANYYISRSLAGGAYVEGGQPAVDDFSAPVFWTTQGTSSADIIAVVNGLPDRKGQTAFTTGEQALNWIASSGNYFAIGPDYFKQINADNLAFNVEGNQIISYPTTGSTWYDLSGVNSNATLYNGPSFNTEGYLQFDGVDDYALVANPSLFVSQTQFTWEFLWRPLSVANNPMAVTYTLSGNNDFLLYFPSSGNIAVYVNGTNYQVTSGNVPVLGKWQHTVFTIDLDDNVARYYVDGDLVGINTSVNQNLPAGTYRPITLFADDDGGTNFNQWFQADVERVGFYSKALTEAEVLQNYYGGPIVTDGLVFHVDANKLISYSTVTGPVWLDMSNTMQQTDLLNGVTWSPENGGVFLFDGVDDIGVNSDPLFEIPDNVTINAWIKESSGGATVGNYMAKANNNGYRMRRNGGASGDPLWIYSSGNSISGGNIYTDVWHMVTGVFSDTGLRAYIDGELVASNSTPYTPANLPFNDMFLGGYQPGSELFGGEMAMAQTYNRALTTEEIQQNYNATK